MGESSVKVGVRVRPLLPREGHCQEIVSYVGEAQVKVKDKLFTFDYVFPQHMSQAELYGSTAFPMLKSFLDGYNVTIIAYGQTGSGKTYTMGSERTRAGGDTQSQGLIPRFLQDLFNNLRDSPDGDRLTTEVDVSFLEIYGDDVYDLLSEDRKMDGKHASLAVREDDKGVSVLGLTTVRAENHQQALEVLQRGTQNRTTAATLMNAVSSRSHAIFSVTLTQVFRPSDFDCDSGLASENHSVCSKLTFVDLAGSERIKRTGADGVQMKEGIQINSGLFALGQVINALADERKLAKATKPAFVPYRNSRLTFLLKDALGGNSQTLFLACASPADSNEFETLSTLDYAYRARNIKNKPVKNTDAVQEQLRRLKCAVQMWTMQAVRARFCEPPAVSQSQSQNGGGSDSDMASAPRSPGCEDRFSFTNLEEELFERSDVREFIQRIEMEIATKLELGGPSPRKIRFSTLPTAQFRNDRRVVVPPMQPLGKNGNDSDEDDHAVDIEGINISEAADVLHALDPEQTEKYLMELMDMLRKEPNDSDDADGDGDGDSEQDGEEADAIDQEILAKEQMLQSVIEFVQNAKDIKQNYEKLLNHIQSLEAEHAEITRQLEEDKAKASANSEAVPAGSVAKLKDRLKAVTEQLAQMRHERKKQEQSYRLYQAEARKCSTLKHEIAQLKESKVALMRKERGVASELRRVKQEKTREINSMKRADSKKQKLVNALELELKKKTATISRKDKDIRRYEEKMNALQKHIRTLVNVQQANRSALRQRTAKSQQAAMKHHEQLTPADQKVVTSTKEFLMQMVRDRVHDTQLRTTYDLKLSESRALAQELKVEVDAYKKLQQKKLELVAAIEVHRASQRSRSSNGVDEEAEADCDALRQRLRETEDALAMLADRVADIDRHLELVNSEAQQLEHDIERLANKQATGQSDEGVDDWEATYRAQVSRLSASHCQALVWGFALDRCDLDAQVWKLEDELARQQSAQAELNEKVARLQSSNAQMQRALQDTLAQAEQKRINDICALLKAYDNVEHTELPTAVQSVLQLRVSELEQALETLLQEKDEWVAHSEAHAATMADLQQQLQTANEKLAVLEPLTTSADIAPIIAQLQQDWDLIGTSEEQRQTEILAISNAVQIAAKETVARVATIRDGLVAERDTLEDEIDILQRALCTEEVDTDKLRDMPLSQQVQWLEDHAASARAQFSVTHQKLHELKDLLVTSMIEMELDVEELPAILQPLASLHVNDMTELSPDDALAERTNFLSALQRQNLTIDAASVASWEATMRDVQTMKAQRRGDALQLQEQCRALIATLELQNEASALVDAVQKRMKESGRAISCYVVPRVVEHLLSNSCGCPELTKMSLEILHGVLAVLEDIQEKRRAFYSDLKSLEVVLADCTSSAETSTDGHLDGACAAVTSQAANRVQQHFEVVEETEAMLQEEWAALVSQLKEVDTSRAPASPSPETSVTAVVDQLLENARRVVSASPERWMQDLVHQLVDAWIASRDALQRVSSLKSDNKHMRDIAQLYQRARKLDGELRVLYEEMHEFEKTASDSTRLHGSSTVLTEEYQKRKKFKARYNRKLLHLQDAFQAYVQLTGKPLNTSTFSKHVQTLVKHNFDKGRIQTTTDLMHLHTRAVRMFEEASAPFEEGKRGDQSPGSDSDVLVDANVGAGTPPTRTSSHSRLVGQDKQEKRKAPKTAGQKASSRAALSDNVNASTPNPMARVTEGQDENVNYAA